MREEFKNVVKDGQVAGYQFGLRTPYFSSVVLSLLSPTELKVDGETIPAEKLSVTLRGQAYPRASFAADPATRWEFGEIGVVTVDQPGGLPPGQHVVDVRRGVLIGFVTGGLYGHDTKKLNLPT